MGKQQSQTTSRGPANSKATHSAKPQSKVAKKTGAGPLKQGESGASQGNDGGFGSAGEGGSAVGLAKVPEIGKTGTPLSDIPANVQIIPKKVLDEQGATTVQQSINNASGIVSGGQDALGFFDHFLIRGLNAQVYSDGFSDGDQLGGLSHSLNGVQGIEIVEGPGSALFGSGPPGGTVNIVHFKPSDEFHTGNSLQLGSFGSITDYFYVTGPSTIPGLDYRIDATASRTDGFRDLASQDYEIRPAFTWRLGDHTVGFALDARHIDQTPDSYGFIYLNGAPITGVSIDAKYTTPFSSAVQDFIRPTLTDAWRVNDFLTINNRFSYLHRTIDALRNNDSTRTFVCTDPGTQKDPVTGSACTLDQVVGRQLRQQSDDNGFFDYQLEPVWKFFTGSVGHTLLTGFEYQRQTLSTVRSTADLPNIADAFDPKPLETSPSALTFKCDSKHSCADDRLAANYYSLYATDQVDMTDKWKIRAGIRQDWWATEFTPLVAGGRRDPTNGEFLVAGVPIDRFDAPVSWNVGTLYKLLPGVSPYFGVSSSNLSTFNSENQTRVIAAPESALQYEAGIKFASLDNRIILNTAAFKVTRDNVAALYNDPVNGEIVVFDDQRTEGVEASLDLRATDQWHLLANVTAQDAIITAQPQKPSVVGGHPQAVPAYMANLWTTYDFSIAGVHGFQVGAGLNYRDVTFSDIDNVNMVPAFIIGNAEVSYETPHWGIRLDIHNITNERYFSEANGAGAYVGEPLSAFVSIKIKN
ncbi:MAG: TonB-dependent receptor [Proteobacteria bacterium]|nr:TonB-dependent receptor [Pseudomonadota bacterium]